MSKQNKRMRTRRGISTSLKYFLLILIAAVQIFPLIWLANYSVGSNDDIFRGGILIWPSTFHWENFTKAFNDGHVLQYFSHSLIVNTLAVLIVIVLALMAAYACTRMKWKLSPVVRNVILLGMMIPIHATLIPNFIIYRNLHILDTIWALLLPYVAFSLPQALFLFCGFMESIPKDIEEAAVIDGCGVFRTLWRIVTPVMRPSIATVAIMTYLNNWNEFMMAKVYLNNNWKTLPFSVMAFAGEFRPEYGKQFAVMLLSALPVIVIYIILNRQIIKGVIAGSVKG